MTAADPLSVPLPVSVHVHVFPNVSRIRTRRRTRTRRRIRTRTRLRSRIRTSLRKPIYHTYPYVIRTFHPALYTFPVQQGLKTIVGEEIIHNNILVFFFQNFT